MSNSENKILGLIFLVYSIISIPFILNTDAVYWDGWVVFNQNPETLSILFDELQNTIHGYLLFIFLNIGNEVYPLRVLMFLMHFLISIFIYHILNKLHFITKISSVTLSIFYLLIPIFQVKVSISIIPFYFSVFLFYLSWFLYNKPKNTYLNIIVPILFFLSFTTGSLLVYYFVFLFYVYIVKYYYNKLSIKNFFKKEAFYLLLPFVFFIIKINLFIPHGLYLNYNQVNLDLSTSFINYLLNGMLQGVFFITKLKLDELVISYGLYALIMSFVFFVFIKKSTFHKNINFVIPDYKSSIILVFGGGLMVMISYFPYLILHKNPVIFGWNSRFMIISILPYSILIYGTLTLTFKVITDCAIYIFRVVSKSDCSERLLNYKPRMFLSLLFFVLVLFAFQSIYIQHKYNVEWFYQTALKQNFLHQEKIENSSTFFIKNNGPSVFFYKSLPFYEWNGLLKQAFGDEKRLMIPFENKADLKGLLKYQHYKQYNFFNWSYSIPIIIEIHKGNKLTNKMLIKLYYYRLFNTNKFNKLSEKLISLKVS